MAWEDVDVRLGDKWVIALLDYSIAECIYCSIISSSSRNKMTDHRHFGSQLQYKAGTDFRGVGEKLAQELPFIIAPHLNVKNRDRHDGGITSKDIIVHCSEGNAGDVNGRDFEIMIFAHDFPERKANLEKSKDAIIEKVREHLKKHYKSAASGFVWILLVPTAFGQL